MKRHIRNDFHFSLALERGPFQGGKGRTKNSMKVIQI